MAVIKLHSAISFFYQAMSGETAGGLSGVHESAIVVFDSPVFEIG